jgi:hypothetical protein
MFRFLTWQCYALEKKYNDCYVHSKNLCCINGLEKGKIPVFVFIKVRE